MSLKEHAFIIFWNYDIYIYIYYMIGHGEKNKDGYNFRRDLEVRVVSHRASMICIILRHYGLLYEYYEIDYRNIFNN